VHQIQQLDIQRDLFGRTLKGPSATEVCLAIYDLRLRAVGISGTGSDFAKLMLPKCHVVGGVSSREWREVGCQMSGFGGGARSNILLRLWAASLAVVYGSAYRMRRTFG